VTRVDWRFEGAEVFADAEEGAVLVDAPLNPDGTDARPLSSKSMVAGESE
jgi:hypothetical protein